MTTQRELIQDTHGRVIAIETHLKDMNGKLLDHDRFIREDCPKKHSDLKDDVQRMKVNYAKLTGVAVGLLALLEIALRVF